MRRRGKILYLKLDTEMIRIQLNGDIYNDAYKCMFVNGIHAQMPNDTASDRFGGKHVPVRNFFVPPETTTCADFFTYARYDSQLTSCVSAKPSSSCSSAS